MNRKRKFSPKILPSFICFFWNNEFGREDRLVFASSGAGSDQSSEIIAKQREFIERIKAESPSSLSTIDKYLIDKGISATKDFHGKFKVVDFLQSEADELVASPAEQQLLADLKTRPISEETRLHALAIKSLVLARVKNKQATKHKLDQHVAKMKEAKQKEILKKLQPSLVENMKENWNKMGKTEKFLGVAAVAFVTIALFTSPKLRRIRDYVLGFATLGGIAIAANAVSKMVSGKGVLDHFDKNIERVDFFEKEFIVDEESAEAFQKGIIYMDNVPMTTLIKGYNEANGRIAELKKTKGLNYVPRSMKYYPDSLRVKGMSRKQVYLALRTFERRYGSFDGWKWDRLKKMSFKDLAIEEMSGDARMVHGMWETLGVGWEKTKEMLGAIGFTKITEPVKGYFHGIYHDHKYTFARIGRGAWHVVEVGAGVFLLTADEIAALIETNLERFGLIEVDQQVKEVEATLDYLKQHRPVASLDKFVKSTAHLGVFQPYFQKAAKDPDLVYEEKDKAFYVIAKAPLGPGGAKARILLGISDAIDNAREVALQKKGSYEYLQAVSGVISGNDYYILMRMPLPKSGEYGARKGNVWRGDSQMEMKNKPELFDKNLWMATLKAKGVYKDALKAHFRIPDPDSGDREYNRLLNYIEKEKQRVGYMPEDVVDELIHLSVAEVNAIAAKYRITQLPGLDSIYRILDIKVARTFPYVKEKVREATKDKDSNNYLDNNHEVAKNIWKTVENKIVIDAKKDINAETDKEKQRELVEECLKTILKFLGETLYNDEDKYNDWWRLPWTFDLDELNDYIGD